MVQAGAEAADDVVYEIPVVDRRAEAIDRRLHAGAVVEHWKIILIEVVEIGTVVDRTCGLCCRGKGNGRCSSGNRQCRRPPRRW